MNWNHYWATKPTQPKIAMQKHHQYREWLQDKNLSPHTITSYLTALNGLPVKFTTQNLKEYFQTNLKKYQATTLKVRKYALNSYVKFKKLKVEWEKIARLIPSVQRKFFDTITEKEQVWKDILESHYIDQRYVFFCSRSRRSGHYHLNNWRVLQPKEGSHE